MSATSAEFETQVVEYIRLFPYQETYKYAALYTKRDPSKLNIWAVGKEPTLVKAGEDKVVRTNNDTFYKMAFAYIDQDPVYLKASVPDGSRFVSFQLMDDRNTNYRNVIYPNGEYTLYLGQRPERVRGQAIEVPSALSVVLVRVEVKNPQDLEDVGAAKEIFSSIAISGPTPADFPEVDLLSRFPEDVVVEGDRRLLAAFESVPFREMVVGPGKEPGREVSYLNHSAGTKGGWGGPDPSHSSYEAFFTDKDGNGLRGMNGTYAVTTVEPPVDAFWSITVYDTDRGGFLHPNKDDRYHINDTTAVKNDDGTVTFMFKQECLPSDRNCLEVPPGRFDVGLRYYLPHEEIQTGAWTFPLIELRRKGGAPKGRTVGDEPSFSPEELVQVTPLSDTNPPLELLSSQVGVGVSPSG